MSRVSVYGDYNNFTDNDHSYHDHDHYFNNYQVWSEEIGSRVEYLYRKDKHFNSIFSVVYC